MCRRVSLSCTAVPTLPDRNSLRKETVMSAHGPRGLSTLLCGGKRGGSPSYGRQDCVTRVAQVTAALGANSEVPRSLKRALPDEHKNIKNPSLQGMQSQALRAGRRSGQQAGVKRDREKDKRQLGRCVHCRSSPEKERGTLKRNVGLCHPVCVQPRATGKQALCWMLSNAVAFLPITASPG